MKAVDLYQQIRQKKSCLSISLDTDPDKIPQFIREADHPQFEFNRRIVEATHDLVIAYKLNLAFYERFGSKGWAELEMTCDYIRRAHPGIFLVADGKRGDIGNTSAMYAEAVYTRLSCDAITLSPYMGRDSVEPFITGGKWVILLGLTSNAGSSDFQLLPLRDRDQVLFERVLQASSGWGSKDNMMYVVGATRTKWLKKVRAVIPEHFLLVPGIGVQGGKLDEVMELGLNRVAGLIIVSGRSVIYADRTEAFDSAARSAAEDLRRQMENHLRKKHLL
jgi:orotidine-5'-phosphate decarboxylase